MLQIHQLRKAYGAATILADVSFIINDGEHVGLIGPNGAGKSTLLKCVVGELEPDSGAITWSPPDLTIGYLPQTFAEMADRTVGEVVAAAQSAYVAAERAVQQAADALATADNYESALAVYESALAVYESLGGYEREHRAAAVLQGLGLAGIEAERPVAELSGGQKTRLGLATLLLREPDLLLLDEPTNHLDVEALEWLESWIRSYGRAVLIVSHDRAFLDRTVTRTLYLDPDSRTIRSYAGSYSHFAAARQHQHELHVEAYKKQQAYIERVETDIARLKGQALGVELSTTPSQPTVRRIAKKVAKKAKSRERKLERYLESDERVDKPKQHWSLKLDFGPPPAGGRAVLRLEEVCFGYPGARPLFSDVSLDVWHGERIALVGPNGAGKTTLLRLIEGRLVPNRGQVRLGANVRVGVLAQEHETLDPDRTVLETARRERPMSETEARGLLHFFLFGGDSVFRRVRECSLGERSRLQLALLVLRGCNLLLLDEPLNHLDIEGREHFEQALDAFEGTVIAVAHDRAFLHHFAERVVEIRDGAARVFDGGYDAYLDHVHESAELR
jgi:ATP-binding cassette, subfamily F, member 3